MLLSAHPEQRGSWLDEGGAGQVDNQKGVAMPLQLGDYAPDFTATTTHGKISLFEYLGDGWVILFSHPRDFTPACTTELGAIARLQPEFELRNTRILALSVDTLESHRRWTPDIEETQNVRIGFPMISDADRSISILYA